MSEQNLTYTFTVDQPPADVFAAVNDVRGWWSGDIEGDTDRPGAEWTYRYRDIHHSKHQITEFVPGKRVAWLVLDGYLNFVDDKNVWTGTEITFDIAEREDKTEVRFTHVGLVPSEQCYGACANAWEFYINSSLRSLITTGKGDPNDA